MPISENALEHTVRPCWFNNRLFVIWAEVELQDEDAFADGSRADTVKVHPRFRLYASYKKYDDSWSTPRVYIENYCQTPALLPYRDWYLRRFGLAAMWPACFIRRRTTFSEINTRRLFNSA